jgi:diaminohydroxyphosphoribosylaminopyrimidine deaminase/5-amino-6-(5-phosphoribosylamino)uracil reductase
MCSLWRSNPVDDQFYMREALRLALKGLGRVSPNPLVGALVVRGETIVGRGYHRDFGGPHAEVNALSDMRGEASGTTLYVTLEPCSHYGKTPPCVDLIIDKGIARVVVGTTDPNPLVAGRGIAILQNCGIQVSVGVLERECRRLNEAFFKYWEAGVPFVTLKMAQSLDGRIAAKNGSSQWISSPQSRKLAHRWRAMHDAVMVGIETVLRDNPKLTVRLVRGRNPHRLIVDSTLRIPWKARVLLDDNAPTMILTTRQADLRRIKRLEGLGARILQVKRNRQGGVDLKAALSILAREGITSVLVEGGARLATSLLKAQLVDKIVLIIGPKIIGRGIEAIGDLGIGRIGQAISLSVEKTRRVGDDLVVTARVHY